METNGMDDIVVRRQAALFAAMKFMKNNGRGSDEKAVLEIAKRFDYFFATGSNARDKTLADAETAI
jgi:hypothetical protein